MLKMQPTFTNGQSSICAYLYNVFTIANDFTLNVYFHNHTIRKVNESLDLLMLRNFLSNIKYIFISFMSRRKVTLCNKLANFIITDWTNASTMLHHEAQSDVVSYKLRTADQTQLITAQQLDSSNSSLIVDASRNIHNTCPPIQ